MTAIEKLELMELIKCILLLCLGIIILYGIQVYKNKKPFGE